MRSYLRVFRSAVAAAGLCCMAQAAPANAGCFGFSGTADGFDQVTAVTRAQAAVADAIAQYTAQKKIRRVTVSAMRATPQPYWRDSVSEHLYHKPDIVKSNSYTVCWAGVISPYVCTSGAKACW